MLQVESQVRLPLLCGRAGGRRQHGLGSSVGRARVYGAIISAVARPTESTDPGCLRRK